MVILATGSTIVTVELRTKKDSRQTVNGSERLSRNIRSFPDSVSVIERLCLAKPEGAERSSPLSHPMSCSGYLQRASTFSIGRSGEIHPEYNGPRGRKRSAQLDIVLPKNAAGSRVLSDKDSRVSVEVSLRDSTHSEAQMRRGHVLYEHGHSSGADLVQVASPASVEEYLVFQRSPRLPSISYDLRLRGGVGGVRVLRGVVEILDKAGIPRVRLAKPFIRGATGRFTDANVNVRDCSYDTNPVPTWGRQRVPPKSDHCTVEIAWAGDTVYPAILDPLWSTAATMIDAVQKFTATTLSDGKVLVAGGLTATGSTANAEIFDPVSQTWSATGGLRVARHNHTATPLVIRTTDRTGLILTVGGETFDGVSTTFPAQTELYDSATGVWTLTPGALAFPRSNHTTSELPRGMVIAVGGQAGLPVTETGTCEIFNPQTGLWFATASLAQARFGHAASLTPSASSSVQLLITGGMERSGRAFASTEAFDPETRVWHPGLPLANARSFHAATLLYSGRLLVVGGVDYTATPPIYPVGAERLDAAATSWLPAGVLSQGRAALVTLQLFNSGVLAAGGFNGIASDTDANTVDLYDPLTNSWSVSASMSVARSFFAASVLSDGSVLASGGRSGQVATSATEQFKLGADGDACVSNVECNSSLCTGGSCTCPMGQVYCPATNQCIQNDRCCTAKDCTAPYDTCHISPGATCNDGVCSYPPLSCPGQACSGGACISAPLSLAIASSASQYAFDPEMFSSGRVTFSASLTNVSSLPISVSLYDGSNIGIVTLTQNGIGLPPDVRVVESEEDPRAAAASALTTIPIGQSRQFQVTALTAISTQGPDYTMATFSPNGAGTYRVVMSYQYTGPDNGFQNVFHGVLTSNEATFDVR